MAGTRTLLPLGQKKPSPQRSHTVWPVFCWYVPSPHMVHDGLELVGAMLPGEHGEGAVAPTPQAVPGGQVEHSSAVLRPRLPP